MLGPVLGYLPPNQGNRIGITALFPSGQVSKKKKKWPQKNQAKVKPKLWSNGLKKRVNAKATTKARPQWKSIQKGHPSQAKKI